MHTDAFDAGFFDRWIFSAVILAAGLFGPAETRAQDDRPIGGYVFGDYYWMAVHHDRGIEGHHGFRIRRIYLTFEQALAADWSTRLRLEMDQPGDFRADAKMTPVVKDVYLKWSSGGPDVYLGIASTPTWSLVEEVWGYRSVEKTPLDLQKLGSSRDFGVELAGALGPGDRLHYDVMVGNGSSNRAEINRGKKFMAAFGYELTERLTAEIYGDWNDQPGPAETYTGQIFLAYEASDVRLGVLGARHRQIRPGETLTRRVASIFGVAAAGDRVHIIARIDRMFDPNPAGPAIDYLPFAAGSPSTLLIGAVDVTPRENIHLIPNIEAVFYGPAPTGQRPASDLAPRLTFHYRF